MPEVKPPLSIKTTFGQGIFEAFFALKTPQLGKKQAHAAAQ